MATKIRLARAGRKKLPYYHIVVADAQSPRDGKFIENVGSYNPSLAKNDPNRVKLNSDRIEHWLKTGAIPTDRVVVFLQKLNVGQNFTQIKKANTTRGKLLELKKVELEERRKKEAEEAARVAAEKAAEDKAAADAAAQAEKDAAEAAKAAEASASETPAE